MSRAVFWDFDGTLAHAHRIWPRSLQQALAAGGHGVSFETVCAHTRTGFSWHTPETGYPEATGVAWWDRLLAHFEPLYDELNMDPEQRLAVNAAFRAEILCPERYTLYGDTVQALAACKGAGWRNFILSNNYPELEQVCGALGLGELLDGCVVSANVGYEKPRRELFEWALALAGHPADCWMIGDNPVADIQGAQALGIPAMLVHSDVPSQADYTCPTLAAVAAILTGAGGRP